ncbi:MAG: hypothetical protein ABSF98_29885 [Bryobacteraceae bacterium]|jgi:hypothetical protein
MPNSVTEKLAQNGASATGDSKRPLPLEAQRRALCAKSDAQNGASATGDSKRPLPEEARRRALCATDTAQKLAEAIALGDVEGAKSLLAAFQREVLSGVAAADSPLQREVLLAEAIRSTRTLLHLARSLRAYAGASLRETNRALGYSGASAEPRSWHFDA